MANITEFGKKLRGLIG